MNKNKNNTASRRKLFPALMLISFLTGCVATPGLGPDTLHMESRHVAKGTDTSQKTSSAIKNYVIVDLDETAVTKINLYFPQHFPNQFKGAFGTGNSGRIGVGDELNIDIWEASGDGLFSTAQKKQSTITITVDQSGNIFIPFVGNVKAANNTVEQLRIIIQAGLQGKAVEPQVLVSMEKNISSNVVVVGDVNNPSKYPLPVRGMRLMEAIATAGGTREATFESIVTVTRGSKSATIRLDEVMGQAGNNIQLAANDYILVIHQPRTFSAFGAVGKSQLMPFKMEKLTLAEALAQVGGLRDNSADRGGVFLLRFEDASLATWLVKSGLGTGTYDAEGGALVPVIYRLDMRWAKSFFIARSFEMRDKDVLYVANHPTAELGKFLSMIVSPIIGTTRTVTSITE